jgi:outer membrane lipoprotein SlyB
MDENKTSTRIHPLMAGAAVAVMLVCLTGVAAMTGLLPTSHGSSAPAIADAAQLGAAPSGKAQLAPTAAPSATTAAAADNGSGSHNKPAPVAKHHSSASHPTQTASSQIRPASGSATQGANICESCGRIESVQAIQRQASGSGLGVAAGAVLGGVLGHQVGNGNGRTLATVAGAVGGGYAGNEIEKRARSTTSYHVRVRMEDGSIRTFPYAEKPSWNAGDRVRVVDGQLASRA